MIPAGHIFRTERGGGIAGPASWRGPVLRRDVGMDHRAGRDTGREAATRNPQSEMDRGRCPYRISVLKEAER